jgi:hypothetical protein
MGLFDRKGGGRSGELYLGGGGLPDPNKLNLSSLGDPEASDSSEEYDSSDIISSSPSCRPLSISYRGNGCTYDGMKSADLENGDSSIGVTLIREEGESKLWERWILILGEGVRGGGRASDAMAKVLLESVLSRCWSCNVLYDSVKRVEICVRSCVRSKE